MKKLLLLVTGLIGLSTFGAELTNKGYVVREVKSIQDQIIEKITDPENHTITNAAAVAAAKDYTDVKAAEGLAAAQAALTDATTALNTKIDNAVIGADAATSNLNVKVNAAIETLTDKIDNDVGAATDTLTAKINSDVTSLSNAVTAKVDADVANLNTTLTEKINTDVGALDTALKAKIEADVAASAETLGAAITAGDTAVSNAVVAKVEAEKAGLVSKIDTDITSATNAVATKAAADDSALSATLTEKINTDVSGLSTTLNSKIDTNVETLTAKINTDVGAVSNNVETKVAELTTKINTDVGALETSLTTKINTDVGNLNTSLTTKITEDIATASGALETKINTDIGTTTSTLTTKINNDVASLSNAVDTAIAAKEASLTTKIDTDVASAKTIAHDELTNFVAQLNAKIGDCTAEDPATAKSYVDALVAAVPKFKIQVVNSVPAVVDAVDATVYLVRNEETAGSQLYSEWIRVNTGTSAEPVYAMEKLGEASVNLTGYAKETYVDGKIDEVNGTITTLAGTVAANKASADDGIATNKADIAALTATVNSNKTEIDGNLASARTELANSIVAVSNRAEVAAAAAASDAAAASTKADTLYIAATNDTATKIAAVTTAAEQLETTLKAYSDTNLGTAKSYADEKDAVIAAGVASNKTDLAALATKVEEDKASLLEDLATSNTIIFAAISQADAKANQGVTDAAGALTFAQGVSNDLVTLTGTVAGNKTDIEGKLDTAKADLTTAFGTADAAVSNNVVAIAAADATAKDEALETSLKSYSDAADTTLTNNLITYVDGEITGAKSYADTKKGEAVVAAIAADTTMSNNFVTIIGTLQTGVEASIAAADAKAVAAQTFAEASSNNVLVAARAYADEKDQSTLTAAEGLVNSAVATAVADKATKTYVDTQDIAVSNAIYGLLKAYTDTKVGTLTEADVASEITSKVGALETSLKGYSDGNKTAAVAEATTLVEGATNAVATAAAADATSKAGAAETAAKTYADEKLVEAKTFTTNEITTIVGDLGQSATIKAYVDAGVTAASNAASAADGKAVAAKTAADAAQDTADAATTAAATADGKAVAAQGTAEAAAAKLAGIDTTVAAYVSGATNNVKTAAVSEATATAATYTDNATNALGGVVSALDAVVASKAATTRVDTIEQETVYNWGSNTSTTTNIENTVYTMYVLENRVNVNAELTSPYLALKLPDAVDASYAKQRGVQVIITTGNDSPSIAILHDENTKLYQGSACFVKLADMQANKTYIIYLQEIGRNKWWYQTEELTEL